MSKILSDFKSAAMGLYCDTSNALVDFSALTATFLAAGIGTQDWSLSAAGLGGLFIAYDAAHANGSAAFKGELKF